MEFQAAIDRGLSSAGAGRSRPRRRSTWVRALLELNILLSPMSVARCGFCIAPQKVDNLLILNLVF